MGHQRFSFSLPPLTGRRDHADVEAMLHNGLIEKKLLMVLFSRIEPALIRYPALDPESFRNTVEVFCNAIDNSAG
ncbi:MAG: hypothetical protein ACKO2G_12550 [Verrucomicrobiales bacterium]